MDKAYPVCARLRSAEADRVVAVFESLVTAQKFVNTVNDSKPLYWDDEYYFVDDAVPIYPEGISLFSILKEAGHGV